MRSRLNKNNLRKQLTFPDDSTTGFPTKWRLRNERRNAILMTGHYSDLGSAFDWSYRVEILLQPIRSTGQIWVFTRHHCGISALVSQTSFRGESSGGVAKMSVVFSGYLGTRPQVFKRWITLSTGIHWINLYPVDNAIGFCNHVSAG